MGYLDVSQIKQAQKSTGASNSVNLSNVTQAAQGPMYSSGGYQKTGSTQLTNPSQQSQAYSAQSTALRNATGGNMINIPGPNIPGGNQGPSGPGPGGITLGNYDAKGLTQDQRQWLWEQNGHKGIAPVGYGGEAIKIPDLPGTAPLAPLPSFVPPTTPAPSATIQPKPASGATTAPVSVSPSSAPGGVMGTPFQALTQLAQGTKGLQMPSLSTGISKLSAAIPQVGKDVVNAIGTFAPQFVNSAGAWGQNLGKEVQSATQNLSKTLGTHTGSWGTPELGKTEGLQDILSAPWFKTVSQLNPTLSALSSMVSDTRTLPGGSNIGQQPGEQILQREKSLQTRGGDSWVNPLEYTGNEMASINPQTRKAGTVDVKGAMTEYKPGEFRANQGMLSGNLENEPEIRQATEALLSGQASQGDVVAGIANQQGLNTVNKMINEAVKVGDMPRVARLANVHDAVKTQLNFINQIGNIVTALAAGFGTQNAPGVTEARMPMMEQGVGQELTSPLNYESAFGGQPTNPVQYRPLQLPTEGAQSLLSKLLTLPETQQQKPNLNAFMG